MFAGHADAAMVANDANSLRTSLSSYDANVHLGGLQKHLPTSVFSPDPADSLFLFVPVV